jgi:hypothetical protein
MSLSQKLKSYGIFLIVIGIIGFLSNPEKAKSALIAGGVAGRIFIELYFNL